MSSGRVGKAIVLTCFFTAGYGRHRKWGVGFRTAIHGRHRSQWVNEHIFEDFRGPRKTFFFFSKSHAQKSAGNHGTLHAKSANF